MLETRVPQPRSNRPDVAPWWRRHYSNLIGYALIAPFAIWVILVIAYPVANALSLSFTNTRVIGSPSDFVGLGNYGTILGSVDFWSAVLRTAVWLLGNVVLQTVIAFGTALFLCEAFWLARVARVWVLLPWVIPTVAVAVIWQWLMNANYGVVSYLLQAAHVIGSPLDVFGSRTGALPGLILTNSWHWFPLSAIFVFGAMQTIPVELYEAARIDGAGAWAQFRFITMPMLSKILFALGLVGGLWTSNVLDIPYLITRGGPVDSTTTLPVEIFDTAFRGLRVGQAAAMSILAVILIGSAAMLYVKLMAPRDD
jgi:multiple sugar transport system permease protein